MKFLIVFVAIAVFSVQGATISDEEKAQLVTYHTLCFKETGANAELIKKAQEGEITDEPTLKKQVFCVSKKIGFQNDEGVIQKETTLKKLKEFLKDDAAAEELYNKCAVQQENGEETAYDTFKCYKKNSPTTVKLFS